MVLNWSQLVRASQGGSMAGLKGWMNGCMSVVLMSCISYQPAAGSATSAYMALVDMRISRVTSRSSLPSGARSRQTTSCGRRGLSVLSTALSVPRRCFRKYSWPLELAPSRFARQRKSTRGKLAGWSGSSTANRTSPFFSRCTTWAMISASEAAPASTASRTRSIGLRSNCGKEGSQPRRAAITL